MIYAVCISSWSLNNTHQIWSQSAEPFSSYALAANFNVFHADVLRASVTPKMSQILL